MMIDPYFCVKLYGITTPKTHNVQITDHHMKPSDLQIEKYIQEEKKGNITRYKTKLNITVRSDTAESIMIRDTIPNGFELVKNEIKTTPHAEMQGPLPTDHGRTFAWEFGKQEPGSELNITYFVIRTDENANPRILQTIYSQQ